MIVNFKILPPILSNLKEGEYVDKQDMYAISNLDEPIINEFYLLTGIEYPKRYNRTVVIEEIASYPASRNGKAFIRYHGYLDKNEEDIYIISCSVYFDPGLDPTYYLCIKGISNYLHGEEDAVQSIPEYLANDANILISGSDLVKSRAHEWYAVKDMETIGYLTTIYHKFTVSRWEEFKDDKFMKELNAYYLYYWYGDSHQYLRQVKCSHLDNFGKGITSVKSLLRATDVRNIRILEPGKVTPKDIGDIILDPNESYFHDHGDQLLLDAFNQELIFKEASVPFDVAITTSTGDCFSRPSLINPEDLPIYTNVLGQSISTNQLVHCQ